MEHKNGMASMAKIVTFLFGIIVLGSLAGTAFGYFTNITSSLTTAGYGWAGTLVVVGIVIGLVYLFIPKRN